MARTTDVEAGPRYDVAGAGDASLGNAPYGRRERGVIHYYLEMFDTWEEAVAFQKEKLQYCLDHDVPVRATEINIDTNFDTKKQLITVLVRGFVIEKEEGPW